MANTEQQRIAERVRSEFRKSQARRAAEIDQGLAPPGLNAGDVADDDGTLFGRVLDADLKVIIEAWRDLPQLSDETSTVRLLWIAGTEAAPDDEAFIVDERVITGPNAEALFPLTLHVPMARLQPDGPYRLSCQLLNYNGEAVMSGAISVICDGTPPWDNEEPTQLVMPAEPITDEYLAQNQDRVVATFADYPNRAPGDRVYFWWGNMPLPDDPTMVQPSGEAAVDDNLQVVFPGDVVRAAGDGGCYVIYSLFDKALNRSRASVYTPVGVALGPWPANLLPPEVPLAREDGLIDLKDAIAGVMVEIPAFGFWKSTDRIQVSWGSTILIAEQIGSAPVFPLQILVPAPVLRSEYGAANGPVPLEVRYQVLRGTVTCGDLATTIDVDFSVIGPENPDPDWPDPVNELLLPARVFGAVSNIENELTPADAGHPAQVYIELVAPVNTGEVVDIYWLEILVATYSIKAGDGAGLDIMVEVPWTIVEQIGNHPNLPVHYRIHGADAVNEQHSPTTLVAADAVTLTPPAPDYLGRNPISGWLTCVSLYDVDNPNELDPAIRVQLPDLSQYLKDGDQLTLTWTPLAGRISQELMDPDVSKTEPIIIGPDTPATGFVWRVQPYEAHIKPIPDAGIDNRSGIGRVTYSFVLNGKTVVSERLEEVVSMTTGAGDCPIPPV